MVPELFSIQRVNSKLSNDARAHFTTVIIILTVIGFYLITKVFPGHSTTADNIAMIGSIGIVSLQAVTRFLPITKNWDTFNSGGIGALIIYNVGIAVFLIWDVPFYSPFILVTVAIMFISIYYRGLMSYLVLVGITAVEAAAAVIKNGYPPVPYGHYYPYVAVLMAIAIGGLFRRAGDIDKELLGEIGTLSQGVEIERRQLASLIDSMTESVLAIDGGGKILFHNSATAKLFGRNDIIRNRLLSEITTIYDSAGKAVNLFNTKLTTHVVRKDLYLMSKNSEKISLYTELSPLTPSQPDKGFILILRDITKEKTLDEERNAFVSISSHELRTPITSAEASIALILSPKIAESLPAKTKDMIERAHDQVLYIANLVNSLGLLSNIENEKLETGTVQVDIAEMLKSLNDEYKQSAHDKGLAIITNLADGIEKINTNELYLREILENLLSNAIKYTDVGRVEINVVKKQDNIIFSVKDTGIGIGTSDKPKLFNKFYRAEDYRTQSTRGTGLGLYITLKLTEYIKGKLWFESEIHKGSTFYLQIHNLSLDQSK